MAHFARIISEYILYESQVFLNLKLCSSWTGLSSWLSEIWIYGNGYRGARVQTKAVVEGMNRTIDSVINTAVFFAIPATCLRRNGQRTILHYYKPTDLRGKVLRCSNNGSVSARGASRHTGTDVMGLMLLRSTYLLSRHLWVLDHPLIDLSLFMIQPLVSSFSFILHQGW